MGQHHDDHTPSNTTSSPHEQRLQFLTRMSQKLSPFLPSSHHHHHHSHSSHTAQYKRPQSLTNELALFSLRKLSVFDNIFGLNEMKILAPVQPGVLSWGLLWAFTGTRVAHATWSFMLGGYKAFLGPRFLATQVGLYALQKVVMFGVDNLRQMAGKKERDLVARKYRVLFGDEFLLDALSPEFYLGKFAKEQHYYGHGHH